MNIPDTWTILAQNGKFVYSHIQKNPAK